MDILTRCILIGILAIILTALIILELAKYGYLPKPSFMADAKHTCTTMFNSSKSHFATSNVTVLLNITHPGFCNSV